MNGCPEGVGVVGRVVIAIVTMGALWVGQPTQLSRQPYPPDPPGTDWRISKLLKNDFTGSSFPILARRRIKFHV
jgi:hypothetical protein